MDDEPPVNPELWEYPAIRRALAKRDITAVYTILMMNGISQRLISSLTGQSQSEVSEIRKGRQLQKVTTLERIADGLGVPRGYMGLAFTTDPTYRRELGEPVGDEVDEDVKRRVTLAIMAYTLFGWPVFGEARAITASVVDPVLPTRLVAADVSALRALIGELRALGRAGHGGMPDVLGRVTTWAERKLGVSDVDTPTTLQEYRSALAELHTLAGWCCYDMQQIDQSRWHYSRALTLANDVGDVYAMVSAAQHLAVGYRELGDPNDALKLYQMASFKLDEVPEDTHGKAERQVWLHVQAARAYAELGQPDRAQDELMQARRLPALDDPFERADLDHLRAVVYLTLGNINTAESYATTAIRTWGGNDLRDSVQTRILLAHIHAQAGEPGVERVAAPAINTVAELRSARARTLLAPLEQALRARGDSTSVDLADRARQVRLTD